MLDLDDKEVAILFERNDLISSSVIDENNKLIGRITIDDVLDVIREDADQNLLGMAGIAEDTFAPPGRAAKVEFLVKLKSYNCLYSLNDNKYIPRCH